MVAHGLGGGFRVAVAQSDKQAFVFVQRLGGDAGVEHQPEQVQVDVLAGQGLMIRAARARATP